MNPTPHQPTPHNSLTNYQFSSDEIRVLRECNTESFFQRSLPLGTTLGVGAYLAVKNGYMQSNVRYGAVPKVVVGVIIGYFIGKFSYQQRCAEKLMQLPNSKLGEVLRQRKTNGSVMSRLNPDQGIGMSMALSPFSSSSAGTTEEMQENAPSNALNLDVESRPTMAGLDDIYRPSLTNPSPYFETELPLEPTKRGMSYEELRKRNREEYEKNQQNVFSRPQPPDAPTVIRENERRKVDSDASTSQKGIKNKYGDTWTD